MNVDLTPEEAIELAQMLRQRAQRMVDRAEELERQGQQTTTERPLLGISAISAYTPNRQVTAEELEASVTALSGRIGDVAARLHTTPERIRSLLEPKSRVFRGERGWLKVRQA